MKNIKIGKYAVPLWLIIVLLVSAVGAVVLTDQLLKTVNIPVTVQDPLEITGYPLELSLFPGETEEFNVTIYNHASVNYSVILDMNFNDSAYQNNYVTFSNKVYSVVPGQQEIATWFSVKSSAPPINASLSVSLKRVEGYSFSDDFDSTTLNGKWSIIDPDGGSSFDLSANPDWLRITAISPPYRDLYGPVAMNAPRIMLGGIVGDFTVETRVMADTDQEWESAGILVWKDSSNFIRLDRACGASNSQRILLIATRGGTWGDSDFILSSNVNPTYLRLVRQGDLFSGYYSSDGTTWTHVGDLIFQAQGATDVGLDVVNVYHGGTFFADFDYFRIAIGRRVFPSGLVGYWKLDEGEGITVYDSSGHDNNGVLVNGPTWVDGKYGKALDFDGVDDYVTIPDSQSLWVQNFTLEAWIYMTSRPYDHSPYPHVTVVNKLHYLGYMGGPTYGYKLDFENPTSTDDQLVVAIGDGISQQFPVQYNSINDLTLNQWHQIVGTFDGTMARIFIDGELKATSNPVSFSVVNDYAPLGFGHEVTGSLGNFKGLIDNVMIYNRALSTEEVAAIYAGQLP